MKHPSLLVPVLLFHAGLCLPAQSWTEAGDAGQLPRTAQVPVGNGALTSISGVISYEADMFAIEIDDPTAFSASTVGGAGFDTQLFLFDERGRGITMRDDTAAGVQSSLSGLFVPARGRYYLAISTFDVDPVGADGEIWSDSPNDTERGPDGPRQYEQISGWNGYAFGGSYTIALTGVSFPGKQLVLPDNHHLSETPNQYGGGGSSSWWRAGGGRFQLIYDASHFASAGVTGPIALKKLLFRGEDGEVNPGGVTWPGVYVQVGATSLTSATMNTAFAANRGAATTTLGPMGLTDVTMSRSLGSTPNNYNIEIDLTAIASGFVLDPTGARPNLLIDVDMPAAATIPSWSGMMAMQDTTGGVAVVRGRGVTSDISSSPAGTDSTSPLVLGVEFAGAGGHTVVVPARNEYYGAACGGAPSSFYEAFLNGQPFDLRALRMLPDDYVTPTYYSVGLGTPVVDASKLNASPNSTADDALVTHSLGFTFRWPGGSTTVIRASTNGFVWLDGVSSATDFSPSTGELLGIANGEPARLAPFWYDLHCGRNVATRPNSGLHVRTDTSGGPGNARCWITWFDVGVFNSPAVAEAEVCRFQCMLHENGTIEYRYGAMPSFCAGTGVNPAIVGFSRGRIGALASVDPQSRDLSLEVPFTTSPEGSSGNIGQTVVATPAPFGLQYGGRAFAGQDVSWNVNHVPPGTLIGVQLLDVAATRPGFALPTITAPGCMLSTTTNALLWEVHVFPSANVYGARQLGIPAGFDGFELYAQYVVLGGLFGAPDLITASSNAVKLIVGRQ